MSHSDSHRKNIPLIEMLIAIAAIGLITVLAVPVYSNHQDVKNIEQAISDISAINVAVTKYHLTNNNLPKDLTVLDISAAQDPWGMPYQYILHKAASSNERRKNKNQIPINNDYDLFSMGKDGSSAPELSANFAQDDIVRANNGKWIGVSEKY